MKKKSPKPRNPIAPALSDPMFRKKIAKSGKDREEQLDPFSKKAKHKNQTLDEFYQAGDKVEIVSGSLKKLLARAEGLRKKNRDKADPEETEEATPQADKKEGVVRVPNGPANTLGITVDGEYYLVDEDDVKLIYEAFAYEDLREWSYAETASGINIPISSEEQEILNMCSTKMYKNDMDQREQEVARRMVSRGILHRRSEDGQIYFVKDSTKLKRF